MSDDESRRKIKNYLKASTCSGSSNENEGGEDESGRRIAAKDQETYV